MLLNSFISINFHYSSLVPSSIIPTIAASTGASGEKGYERALAAISSGEYDLVVLDEYNMALFFELITWDKTKALLDARHPETELVFTGRGAPQELIDEADLVTEMKEVKHYYLQGVMARKGIEN